MFQYKSSPLGLISAISLLLSICLLNIDNYFGYHAPSAMSSDFERLYMLNDEQFGSLFTIYSLPNVVLVFFSGVFIDKYGVRVSSLVFNFYIVIGLLICAFTPYPSATFPPHMAYISLLIGRLLLGIGGESVVACASTMISKWFTKDGYLNTAMSINQAIVQLLGSAASFFILPRLSSLFMAQLFTAGVAVFSLLCNIIYVYLEIHHEDVVVEVSNGSIVNNGTKDIHYQAIDSTNNESIAITNNADGRSADLSFNIQMNTKNNNYDDHSTCNTAIESQSHLHSYQAINSTGVFNIHDDYTNNANINASNSINNNHNIFFALSDLPLMFWLVMLHCGCLSPILYTFTAFGSLYLLNTFPSLTTLEEASDVISLLYLGIVFSPLTGFVIDRCGHRILIQLIATMNILVLFLLLIFIPTLNPYFCLGYMGILFSITESNYLAMIGYIIPEEKLGTAYGVSGCVISIALLIEPATVGYLRQSTGSFASSIWLYIALIIVSVSTCVAMLILQKKSKNSDSNNNNDKNVMF